MTERADKIKEILLLEFLAIVGIVAPILVFMAGYPGTALIMAGLYWAMPGLPIPIVHLFIGGWMPFYAAYPMSLLCIFEDGDST